MSDVLEGNFGKLNPKVWSDVRDIDAIWSLPDASLHRNVDKIIQQAATAHGDRLCTAVMCPPDIYGMGKGPGRKESFYIPLFWEEVEKLGATFYQDAGANKRSFVHIDDLMKIYLKLIEAAAAGGEGVDWGLEVSPLISNSFVFDCALTSEYRGTTLPPPRSGRSAKSPRRQVASSNPGAAWLPRFPNLFRKRTSVGCWDEEAVRAFHCTCLRAIRDRWRTEQENSSAIPHHPQPSLRHYERSLILQYLLDLNNSRQHSANLPSEESRTKNRRYWLLKIF